MFKIDCICLRNLKDFRIGFYMFGILTKFYDIHIGFISIYLSKERA